ncbi:MAG: DUF72 domain-containing protein [bacterium]
MGTGAEIRIGTSGWSYPKGEGTWNGTFYPKGVKGELEYYAQRFSTVEVNSAFYRPPEPGVVWGWVRRTPDSFRFAVKLWQKFTHPKMYQEATGESAEIQAGDVELFRKAIDPLATSGKLAALLAQFPPSLRNNEGGQAILTSVMEAFRPYPLAVELRHKSWSDDPKTAQLLGDYNAAWVRIDEPRFELSIAGRLPITAPLSYFRFHGRNAADWWRGNVETRYKYLYSEEELKGLAERVRETAEDPRTERELVFFNNHFSGYAPRNASGLAELLELPFQKEALSL